MTNVQRAVVIGLGSMGQRRLESLKALGVEAVALTRAVGAGSLSSREEVDEWGADAVVVCSPTSRHLDDVRWALEGGRHVFVEKPLAASLDGVDEVVELAERSGLCLAVGYNLRFHPGLETIRAAIESRSIGRLLSARLEVGQFLPDWHPEEHYRESYVAQAGLGGGALLTLSHELDLALWIGGPAKDAGGIAKRVSTLELDVDDVAEVLLEHDSGAVTSVHVDLLDRAYNRRSRWVGSEATLVWEWEGPVLRKVGAREDVLWKDGSFTIEETYRRELADFLTACADGRPPRADGHAARAVLAACGAVTVRS
jgi:predicted dehydrogenase